MNKQNSILSSATGELVSHKNISIFSFYHCLYHLPVPQNKAVVCFSIFFSDQVSEMKLDVRDVQI